MISDVFIVTNPMTQFNSLDGGATRLQSRHLWFLFNYFILSCHHVMLTNVATPMSQITSYHDARFFLATCQVMGCGMDFKVGEPESRDTPVATCIVARVTTRLDLCRDLQRVNSICAIFTLAQPNDDTFMGVGLQSDDI